MPAYDYDCEACGRRFEVSHSVYADPPTTCPLCGKGPIRKAISAPAIHYKGSGWAKKERHATKNPGSSRSTTDVASGDGGSGDSGSGDSGSGGSGESVSPKDESGSSKDGPTSDGPKKTTKTEAATAKSTD